MKLNRGISKTAAALLIITSTTVLCGWLLGIGWLTSIVSGWATMKFNTALCFLFSGVSLWNLADNASRPGRTLGILAAGFVAIVAGVSAAQYALGFDAGIDQLFFVHPPVSVLPGRMSPATGICLSLSGAALLLLHLERFARLAQLSAVFVAFIALITIQGYLLGSEPLSSVFLLRTVAVHTATSLLILSAGILVRSSQKGFMATFTSPQIGGIFARRFLGFSLLIPVLLAWGFSALERTHLYQVEAGHALFATLNILMFGILIWFAALYLNKMHGQLQARSVNDSFLASIVESSADAIVTKNVDGIITSWNRGAMRLFGHTPEHAIGKHISLIIPENLREEEETILRRIRAGEKIEAFETVRVRAGGKLIDLSIAISPLFDENSKVIGASKIARSISDLKKADAQFRMAFDAAPSAMLMVNRSGQIMMANTQVELLFGYERSEILKKDVEELIPERFRSVHPAHRDVFTTAPTARTMGGGGDLFARRKDGSEFPVEIGLNPMQTDDGDFTIVSIIDITERTRTVAELKARSDELLQSNQDLERFAFAASHDLREPLRAVTGCLQLLEQRYSHQLDARGNEFIFHAVDGARRMQRLIDDLLLYSRVTTQGEPFGRANLNQALNLAVKNLSVAIQETNARIKADGLPKAIRGDASQLAMLFQNLIGNAVKFKGEQDPEILITSKNLGTEVVISVQDNGIGIDPEYSDRIFAIFQRLHTRVEYPGTGVGLALCRRIVERHGGRIWVESTVGQGSTFYFTLPVEPGTQA
ncbi:MAG: PAS domain S-box protein [Leptospirales bacterium]|nr:PAS domain S-box protein [Leptospirales bacterium]